MKIILLVDMLIDQDMLDLINGLYDTMSNQHIRYVVFSQMLCALFMFLYFSMEAYKMMVGDKRLEIMPLLRPFALSMVIMFWGSFVQIIKKPAALLADAERSSFITGLEKLEKESRQRYALSSSRPKVGKKSYCCR